jgi:hypothetical protein
MKKETRFILIVYIFLLVSGSVYGIGEKTLVFGGESGWKIAESRAGVTEAESVRPHPVLILCSVTGASTAGYSAASGVFGNFAAMTEPALDMSLSFDERDTGLYRDGAGRYSITVSPEVEAVDRRFARAGTGAALFGGNMFAPSGSGPLVIEPHSRRALFAPGNRIGDFTVEFWLYPMNLENGEGILTWISSKPVKGEYTEQRIQCVSSRNRLEWSFENFFFSPDGVSRINIRFSGDTPVVPKTWSHHLVRFDATTGMIEYLVDGGSETIVYATSTGSESGEVYTPVAGNGGIFEIGGRFTGLMDEFKIHSVFAGRSSMQKYASSGGRMETGVIDLGEYNSGIVRIDATGGRTGSRGLGTHSEFRENGRLRFSDDAEMNFFARASNYPYRMDESAWTSFTPGKDLVDVLHDDLRGRYLQIAVDFYPSADGENSPYLDELRVIYIPGEPPKPPGNLTAAAVDGGAFLRWKHSPDSNMSGYLVYYSAVRGDLFGEGAALGPSPVDAGKNNSLLIDGLKNGTLYYFRIAAYDNTNGSAEYRVGEFSKEVTARPLKGLLPAE